MNAISPISAVTVRSAMIGAPEERAAIDSFVRAHSEAQPFHLPAWSQAVERACGHRSHYLVALGSRGNITGVLPLTEIRSRLFGSGLVSAGFGVGGGVIAIDGNAAEALADQAWALAQRLGCPSLELRGGSAPSSFNRREGVYAAFAAPISADEEAVLKSIPRKRRAEIRRALGLGLEVTIGAGQAERDAHYRVYAESVRNLGTPVFPKTMFDAILGAFSGEADILTIRKDGKPLASVLSFYFNGTVYPYWGGGTAAARSCNANELLYFELMRHAAARGCTRFDFSRSKLGTGAFAFKKLWGMEPRPLVYWTKGEARDTNPLSAKYRLQVALWRKLPLPVANRLGPVLARGLG